MFNLEERKKKLEDSLTKLNTLISGIGEQKNETSPEYERLLQLNQELERENKLIKEELFSKTNSLKKLKTKNEEAQERIEKLISSLENIM